jgi:hypothetical protein
LFTSSTTSRLYKTINGHFLQSTLHIIIIKYTNPTTVKHLLEQNQAESGKMVQEMKAGHLVRKEMIP